MLLRRILAFVTSFFVQLQTVAGVSQYNERINTECLHGFTKVSSQEMGCSSEEDWTFRVPICKRRCPDPAFLSDLRRTPIDYAHGEVQHFYCSKPGSKLSGASTITCDNGKWSGPVPTCKPITMVITRSGNCGNFTTYSLPANGEIMSPGYPGSYSNNNNCSWKISSNTRILLYFKTFQTESTLDRVNIYDGGSSSAPSLGVYSGSTLPPYITSSSNRLYITFTTDGSLTYKGFVAKYQALKTGSIRLVNGSSTRSGRVEMFINNQWGTICDDNWDITNAAAVCRQLGFRGAVAAHEKARFGPGTGEIWLDEHKCSGLENHILECSHNNWGKHNCGHSEDASVECQSG